MISSPSSCLMTLMTHDTRDTVLQSFFNAITITHTFFFYFTLG